MPCTRGPSHGLPRRGRARLAGGGRGVRRRAERPVRARPAAPAAPRPPPAAGAALRFPRRAVLEVEEQQDADGDGDRREEALLVHGGGQPCSDVGPRRNAARPASRRHRVEAARVPGVAAEDPPGREPGAARPRRGRAAPRARSRCRRGGSGSCSRAPAAGSIGRRGRRRAARRRPGSRRRRSSPSTPAWRSAPRRSPSSCAKGRAAVASRAISTRSQPGAASAERVSRAASRRRRLARLRTTAPPIFLVAVKPRRSGLASPGAAGPAARGRGARPCGPVPPPGGTRCAGSAGEGGPAWDAPRSSVRPPSGAELLPALRAAGGQHVAAAHGRHAGAEAVPALPDELGGLVGTLHGLELRSGTGRAPRPAPHGQPAGGPLPGPRRRRDV